MAPISENPFAALTTVVAPAILTNASSVLCLGTANRLARVVDRTRVVSAELARVVPNAKSCVVCRRQLEALRARWTLVLRALRLFYLSLGSFAAATLISLFGAVVASSGLHIPFPFTALLGLVSGTLGCWWRRAKGPLWQRQKGPGCQWWKASSVSAQAGLV
jgi:hypothetical protein